MHSSRFSVCLVAPFFLFGTLGTAGITACSKSNSSSKKKKKGAESSQTFDDPTAAGTVAIASGSVEIPANTLTAGSQVVLKKTKQPEQFSAVTSYGTDSASDPLSFTVKDASGNSVKTLESPVNMTIKISTDAAALVLATGYDDLCVLFESPDNEHLAWYNSTLSINTTTLAVSFRTKRTGIYQLFRCGEYKVMNFNDAADTYASGLYDGTWLLTSEDCDGTPTATATIEALHRTMAYDGTKITYTYMEVDSGNNINCSHTYNHPVTFNYGSIEFGEATAEVCTPVSPAVCGASSCRPADSSSWTSMSTITPTTWSINNIMPSCTQTYTLQ